MKQKAGLMSYTKTLINKKPSPYFKKLIPWKQKARASDKISFTSVNTP